MDVNASMPAGQIPEVPLFASASSALFPPTALPLTQSAGEEDPQLTASIVSQANPSMALAQVSDIVQEPSLATRAAHANFSESRQVSTPRRSASVGKAAGRDVISRVLHQEFTDLSLSESRVKTAVREWSVSDNHISELKSTLTALKQKIDETSLKEEKQLHALWKEYKVLSVTVMDRASRLYGVDPQTALNLLELLIQNDDRHVSYSAIFSSIKSNPGFERFIIDHVKNALTSEIQTGSAATVLRQSGSFEYKLVTILQNGYLTHTMEKLDKEIGRIQNHKLQDQKGGVKVKKAGKACLQLLHVCMQGLNERAVPDQLKEIYRHVYQELAIKYAMMAVEEKTAYIDNKLINFYFLRSVNAKLASGGQGTPSELIAKTFQTWLSYDPQAGKERLMEKKTPIFLSEQKGKNLYYFVVDKQRHLLSLLAALKKLAEPDTSSAASAAAVT